MNLARCICGTLTLVLLALMGIQVVTHRIAGVPRLGAVQDHGQGVRR